MGRTKANYDAVSRRSSQRVFFNKFSLSHALFSAILIALWPIADDAAETWKIQRQ